MQNALIGKRVLITQSTEFTGPVLCKVLAEQGATVVASAETLSEPGAACRVVRAAEGIDVLVVNPRFQERLTREVPLGRLVSAREDAQFAAYLCSSAADCFAGQVFPACGGWVPR